MKEISNQEPKQGSRQYLGNDDEKIKNMGLVATKKSLIIKLFVRYFISAQRVFFKEAPRIWQKHWTVGEVIPIELDEEKKNGYLATKKL